MDIQPIHEMLLKDKPLSDELSVESEEVWQRLLQELIDLKGQSCFEQIIRYLKPGELFQTIGQARWERFLARNMLSVKELPIDVFERMALRYLEAGLYIVENRGDFLADDKAEEDFFSRLYEAKQIEASSEDSKTKDKLEEIKALFPHVAKIVEIGEGNDVFCSVKKKIAFFVKPGMDSFLGTIIKSLQDDYIVEKYVITEAGQIDKGMAWADICWFEWCDELVIYGSKLEIAKEKRVICRIHGYEVYSNLISQANWLAVDQLIVVAPHILRIFREKIDENLLSKTKIDLVFCGVDISLYPLQKHQKGYNIGYLGYINFKKNLPLTLDIFYQLYLRDRRYKLYIAGEFQDERTFRYVHYFINERKLQVQVEHFGKVEQ